MQTEVFCPGCGKKYPFSSDINYCKKCGASLKDLNPKPKKSQASFEPVEIKQNRKPQRKTSQELREERLDRENDEELNADNYDSLPEDLRYMENPFQIKGSENSSLKETVGSLLKEGEGTRPEPIFKRDGPSPEEALKQLQKESQSKPWRQDDNKKD